MTRCNKRKKVIQKYVKIGEFSLFRNDAEKFFRAKNESKRISKGGFNTKAEAISEGVKAMNEYLNSGTVFVPSEVSVHDYLDHWIKIYCIPNLKPTTVANYKKHIRLHIAPKIGIGY